MKTTTFLSAALSASQAYARTKFISAPDGWAESLGYNVTDTEGYPHMEANIRNIGMVAPGRQQLKPRSPQIPGSKTVKVRYGPYTIPASMIPGGEGMIWNRPLPVAEKPCSKCLVLGMNAGLEFANGADANTDSGYWLHHMVLFNIGAKAWDATCQVFGLPHMIVGSLPATSERIFSSGNERTMALFNPPGSTNGKLGYPLWPSDRFGMIIDLMSMAPQTQPVWLTMYYDYVDNIPTDFEEVKPIWFDAAQCGTSERGGGAAGSAFDIGASPWVANFEGDILGVGGHIHDGGTSLDITMDNKVVCTSWPTYGTDEEARTRANIIKEGGIPPAPKISASDNSHKFAGAMGGHGHAGGKHIIAMTVCGEGGLGAGGIIQPLQYKKLKKGQVWNIAAKYDYKRFDGMKNNYGGMDSVMGIAIMYVKTTPKIRASG